MLRNTDIKLAIGLIAGVLQGCSSSAPNSELPPLEPITLQTAVLSISDPGGAAVVTFTQQPENIALVATSTASGATTSLKLTATNNTSRIVFSPKVVVESVSDATADNAAQSSSTGTTREGKTFASFGFNALARDATSAESTTIDFTDVDGLDDPLIITLSLPVNEHMAYGQISTDEEPTPNIELLDINGDITNTDIISFVDPSDENGGSFIEPVVSPDGRFVYAGNRNQPILLVLDTVNLTVTGLTLSEEETGNVAGVQMSSDGQFLYAAYNTNTHFYDGEASDEEDAEAIDEKDIEVYVVKIRRSDLNIVNEVLLPEPNGDTSIEMSAHSMDLSTNNRTLVVGFRNDTTQGQSYIYAIDTEGGMTVGLSFDAAHPRQVAINGSGSTIYYATGSNDTNSLGNLHQIDIRTGNNTIIELTNPDASVPVDLDFGPDGRLYYMRDTDVNALAIFDFSVGTLETVIDTVDDACGIDFSRDGKKYFICDGGGASIWDISNDTQIQAASTGNIERHGFAVSPF